MSDTFITEPDVVLIGAGIMSSTLGVFLKDLEPSLSIEMFETLEGLRLRARRHGTTLAPVTLPIAK